MTILIIDDDALIRHAYSQYLIRKGYIVYQAGDGNEGIKLLQHTPEITKVVLDAYMPEMDAFKFLRHIQDDSLFKTKHPDIFFVSAWDRNHICARLVEENIDQTNIKEIFEKPIDLAVLLSALQS